MRRLKGFLLAESMVALILAIMGVSSMALIVSDTRTTERKIELKTDRIYAWRVLKKNNLKSIMVHDQLYELRGEKSIYDISTKETYYIKK
ncbi:MULTISPECIES: hypothetical protein [unclassified Lactobacillus]|uniref:hypothetical protein n=1 Tax=unclassified Lactobacillus TaxID=2620435 RepID=UPI0011C39D0D|nr:MULTISPECIES: hypothetical protein [unclassified Lactobacillus]